MRWILTGDQGAAGGCCAQGTEGIERGVIRVSGWRTAASQILGTQRENGLLDKNVGINIVAVHILH